MVGNEEAWEHVVREYRPALYRTADTFDPAGGGRDVADALYGELFSANEKGGEHRSLLRYFHGRSSLSTWLRSVLTQRLVGRLRSIRRERALPDEDSPEALPAPEPPSDPERERHITLMSAALGSAIAALDARDRLRLGCYYAEELTLAETGRILREHEATVSRHLARTRQAIKADVERRLREEAGLTHEAIAECFASVAADPGPLDLWELVGPADPVDLTLRKETAIGHSKKEQRV
jgi:RNA polymerase sigma factor (sigma-70 family)